MTAKASCALLALLLLVGTQIASSKSVVGTYEDVAHALNKRAAEEDATTLPPSTTPNDKSRRETEPTTAMSNDDADSTVAPDPEQTDDKEPATVKPLDDSKSDKEETTEKPKEPRDEKKPAEPAKEPRDEKKPAEPAKEAGRPEVANRLSPEVEVPAVPELPVASLVPPISFGYEIPQPYHGFVPQLDPGFAPYPWNLAPAPAPVAPVFYEYPQPSGPAFSEGASASAGSFAGATATASGTGGTVITSTSQGGNGRPQVSSSSSSSGPGAPGVQPVIGSRGSFPADEQSVGIEVDGPAAPGRTENGVQCVPTGNDPQGKPQFQSGPGFASLNGPGYSGFAGGSFGGNQFGPNPYAGSYPMYSPFVDYGNYFQQYFAALQAQQMAFQRQLQAQIQAQQQAGGSSASGGAYISNGQGMVDPSAQVTVNTFATANSASSATSVDSRTGLGGTKSSVSAIPPSNKDNANSIWAQSNRIDSNFGFPTSSSSGPQTAYAGANIGPQGGSKTAYVNPASPGIFSRFGDTIPPPSGGSYGVFTSSSSSTQTGPDGKPISHKVATIGVNDNGKVTYQTVHDP